MKEFVHLNMNCNCVNDKELVLNIFYDLHSDFDTISAQEWHGPLTPGVPFVEHNGLRHVVVTSTSEVQTIPAVSTELRSMLKRIQNFADRKCCAVIVHNKWSENIQLGSFVSSLLVVVTLLIDDIRVRSVACHLPSGGVQADEECELILTSLGCWMNLYPDDIWLFGIDGNCCLGKPTYEDIEMLRSSLCCMNRDEVCMHASNKLYDPQDARGAMLSGWQYAHDLMAPTILSCAAFTHRHWVSHNETTKDFIFIKVPKSKRHSVMIEESCIDPSLMPKQIDHAPMSVVIQLAAVEKVYNKRREASLSKSKCKIGWAPADPVKYEEDVSKF